MGGSDWIDVGAIRILAIEDGLVAYEPGDLVVSLHEDPTGITDELRTAMDADGTLRLPYRPTLLRTPDATILVDAGTGPEVAGEWEEDAGHALASLQAAGVGPDDVGVAVITHAHPDHLSGFLRRTGDELLPTFPRARHLVSAAEWRYWVDGDPGGHSRALAPDARRDLTALRDAGVLALVPGDDEIAEGVRLLPTPGHTPGHVCVLVASGGDGAVVSGDAILTAWSLPHPEWIGPAEVDPERTLATRRALLERLAGSGEILFGFHLPSPGRVRRDGEVYAFEPL